LAIFLIIDITILVAWGIISNADKDTSVNIETPNPKVKNEYQHTINNDNPITINIDLSEEFVDAIKRELNLTNSTN